MARVPKVARENIFLARGIHSKRFSWDAEFTATLIISLPTLLCHEEYVYVCVCVCVCLYIYICIYIHIYEGVESV
jgi:hypothetical protein